MLPLSEEFTPSSSSSMPSQRSCQSSFELLDSWSFQYALHSIRQVQAWQSLMNIDHRYWSLTVDAAGRRACCTLLSKLQKYCSGTTRLVSYLLRERVNAVWCEHFYMVATIYESCCSTSSHECRRLTIKSGPLAWVSIALLTVPGEFRRFGVWTPSRSTMAATLGIPKLTCPHLALHSESLFRQQSRP